MSRDNNGKKPGSPGSPGSNCGEKKTRARQGVTATEEDANPSHGEGKASGAARSEHAKATGEPAKRGTDRGQGHPGRMAATAAQAPGEGQEADRDPHPPGPVGSPEAGACGSALTHQSPLAQANPETRLPFPFPETAPAAALAHLLGVSPRRIRQLAEDGRIARAGRGLYPVRETVSAYLEAVSAAPLGRDEARLLAARADRMEHLAQVARHQAAEARRRADLLAGRSVDSDILAPVLNEMIATARAGILSMPRKLAGALADMQTAGEIEKAMAEEIHAVLSELANPGQEFFEALAAKYRANEKRETVDDMRGDQPVNDEGDL